MIRYKLGERIAEKSFRDGKKVTIETIIRETGIQRSTLSKILNQRANATMAVMEKLCAYFDVEVGEMVTFVKEAPAARKKK